MKGKRFLYDLLKVILTVCPPIAIGIISAIIDWDKYLDDNNAKFFYSLVALSLLFIVASFVYVFIETKNLIISRKLNKITKINEIMHSSSETNQENYKEFKKGAKNGQLRFGIWGFAHECHRVCKGMFDFFCEFKKSNNVIISIVQKDSMGQYKVLGLTHDINCNIPPRYSQKNIIFTLDKNLKDNFDRMYNSHSNVFSKDNTEIKEKYMFDDTETTYSRYVSVPIYDKTSNNRKIIARLEITSYDKMSIFDNLKDAQKYFQYYFSPMIVWLENVYQIEEILRTLKQ